MKYLAAFIISLLTMIGLRQVAQADSTVNISNDTSGGSNTHVVVNSNVNSSNVTTTNVNSHTTVHIENNGEVKDFDTNGDESVDWQSTDGKSSVKINNNGTTVHTDSPTTTPTSTVTPTPADDEKAASMLVKINHKSIAKLHASFIANLLNWFASLFK